jgi:hypothetical protein
MLRTPHAVFGLDGFRVPDGPIAEMMECLMRLLETYGVARELDLVTGVEGFAKAMRKKFSEAGIAGHQVGEALLAAAYRLFDEWQRIVNEETAHALPGWVVPGTLGGTCKIHNGEGDALFKLHRRAVVSIRFADLPQWSSLRNLISEDDCLLDGDVFTPTRRRFLILGFAANKKDELAASLARGDAARAAEQAKAMLPLDALNWAAPLAFRAEQVVGGTLAVKTWLEGDAAEKERRAKLTVKAAIDHKLQTHPMCASEVLSLTSDDPAERAAARAKWEARIYNEQIARELEFHQRQHEW